MGTSTSTSHPSTSTSTSTSTKYHISALDQRTSIIAFSVHPCRPMSAGYLKNLWSDFYESFWTGGAWLKEETIRLPWWRSGLFRGSWIIFQDSSALRDRIYCDRCYHLANVYELMYATQPTLASSSSLSSAEVHAIYRVLYSQWHSCNKR